MIIDEFNGKCKLIILLIEIELIFKFKNFYDYQIKQNDKFYKYEK